MAVTGSYITLSDYNTKFIEENDNEEGNETFNDDQIPVSSLNNEIQTSTPINDDLPEQQQNHTDHEHDHPVVAEAYKVNSFLIVEAKPVRRNNLFIIFLQKSTKIVLISSFYMST